MWGVKNRQGGLRGLWAACDLLAHQPCALGSPFLLVLGAAGKDYYFPCDKWFDKRVGESFCPSLCHCFRPHPFPPVSLNYHHLSLAPLPTRLPVSSVYLALDVALQEGDGLCDRVLEVGLLPHHICCLGYTRTHTSTTHNPESI